MYADASNYIAIAEANYVTHLITGQAQEYRHLIKGKDKDTWETSFTNELVCLAQGVGNQIEGINTINSRQKSVVPKNKKVTYGRLVYYIKEHKTETHCTELMVGVKLLDFSGMLSTPTTTVTTTKCLFNSVISTRGAKCLISDI